MFSLVFVFVLKSGCSSWVLLREAELPPVQLEHFGWCAGVCVSDRHSGVSGLVS